MAKRKKTRNVKDDGFSYVCALCQDFGELICCEQCGQGFHLQCLNFKGMPEEHPWFCDDCKNCKVRCFECKIVGNIQQDAMFKCPHKTCKNFYHQQCTTNWTADPQDRSCQQHKCTACGSRKNSGEWKLLRCLECPVAYHENCFPEGSFLLDDIPGYMICRKHENGRKGSLGTVENQKPAGLFPVLPIPEQICEFEVPQRIHDFVKKLKSKPFVHIRRNVYLVKKSKRRPEEEYMQCGCANANSTRQSCERDCICSLLQYTCSSGCGCGPHCTNLPFQKRPGKKLQLTKTEKCGWGLIAAEQIKAGDFLIEYVGEVINDKMCEERLWGMKERGDNNFYMCEISREMVIDATFKGNLSRFINHSCCPNTQLQKWQIDGETRIGVFAISDIQEGEAISYDYKFIPFGQDQDCFCGASACRGKLGRKSSKQATVALQIVTREVILSRNYKRFSLCGFNSYDSLDRYFYQRKPKFRAIKDCGGRKTSSNAVCLGRRVRILWPLDNKYYSGTIIDFDNVTKRHTILYDDGDLEMLNMEKETWELEKTILPVRSGDALDVPEESATIPANGDIVSQ